MWSIADAGIRKCPPFVSEQSIKPSLHQRRTLAWLTCVSLAVWPVLYSRSSWGLFILPPFQDRRAKRDQNRGRNRSSVRWNVDTNIEKSCFSTFLIRLSSTRQ